jgi:hypothetical protein
VTVELWVPLAVHAHTQTCRGVEKGVRTSQVLVSYGTN